MVLKRLTILVASSSNLFCKNLIKVLLWADGSESMWITFSWIVTLLRIETTFNNEYCLPSSGIILLSISRLSSFLELFNLLLTQDSFSNKNQIDVNYTIIERNKDDDSFYKFSEVHSMRHFSLPEIDFIANVHGFEIVEAHDLVTKKIPSEDTWAIFVVLRKKWIMSDFVPVNEPLLNGNEKKYLIQSLK